MEIEYDAAKAEANLAQHGVSFEEAASALLDPLALVVEDHDSGGESGWVLLGMSARPRLLTVVYSLRDDDRVRLISARKATRTEVKNYA